MTSEAMLKQTLEAIVQADHDYPLRYALVFKAISLAQQSGLHAGFRIDPKAPEWPVAYIELPTGQVSWHMPQHAYDWDGHTTEQKFARIADYAGTAYVQRPSPRRRETEGCCS